jgi:hypothetical protein
MGGMGGGGGMGMDNHGFGGNYDSSFSGSAPMTGGNNIGGGMGNSFGGY